MKALTIARVNMVRTLRDRMSLFFTLVLPMILIVVLGMTYGGMSAARVGVADEDGGPLAVEVANGLDATAMRLDVRRFDTGTQLRDAVERGFVELGIVIHRGYDAAVRGGGTGSVEVVAQPRSYASAIRTTVDAAIADQAALIVAARAASGANGVSFEQALATARVQASNVAGVGVTVRNVVDAAENPSGFAVGAESQVILFMFLTSMTGAVALITTRLYGISRREFSTPTRAGTIVLGETLGRFAFALFQGLFIVGASALLFGVDWIDPLATGAIIVLFALVASGAAMLLATLVSNEHQLSALGPALGMTLALLGGAMVPIEVFPPVMQTLAHLTPHAWALDAFHDLLLNGGGVVDILPQLAVLLAIRGRTAGLRVVPVPASGHRRHRLIVRRPLVRRRRGRLRRPRPDEIQDLGPCRGACVGVFGGLAVEETVRGTLVGHQSVIDAGGGQRRVEPGDGVGRDVRVGAAEHAEDRARHRARDVDRRRHPAVMRSAREPIEADRSGQVQVEGRTDEGEPPAETEADREQGADGRGAVRPERRRSGPDVVAQPAPGRLIDVRAIAEGVIPRRVRAGRPPEVVDGERVDALFGEAERKLLEERVQPPDVGQDEDRRAGRLVRPCPEAEEPVPV